MDRWFLLLVAENAAIFVAAFVAAWRTMRNGYHVNQAISRIEQLRSDLNGTVQQIVLHAEQEAYRKGQLDAQRGELPPYTSDGLRPEKG